MKPLTPRQQSVLEFIWAEVQKRKRPPTLRQIAAKFKMADGPSGPACHLKALVQKGWLEVDYGSARGLRLTRAAKKRLGGIPLVELVDLNRE